MWKNLIFDYAKSLNRYTFTLNELFQSPICYNKDINRRLKMDSLKDLSKWLVSKKFADFTSKDEQDKIFVYWTTP